MKGISCQLVKKAWLSLGLIAMVPLSALTSTQMTSFKPGKDWYDVDGKLIDCHAGNIIYQAETKTYFWFGEHRGSPAGASCYSSQDLYNWKFRGVALNTGATEGLKGGFIERPKVAYNQKTKKYAMWFHYENAGSYGLAHQGVAVCDSAPGPYKFLQHSQPNGHQSRDIGMFQDEDGKVYIGYAANNGSSINAEVRLVQLADDYLSVTTNDVVTGAHCEGPGMLKWNDKYYLLTSLCSGWDPNEASYYTCSKVLGSYTKIGSPCPSSEKKTYNSQPSSIFKIPGYSNGFLYVGDRWNGGGSTKSQNVFLPIIMTSDGKMQLKWYDEWKIATVFTASAAVDDRSPSFKKAVYENVLHKSGLHVCDLLGRNVACYYGKSPSGAVFIIDKSGVKTAPASGRYVAR